MKRDIVKINTIRKGKSEKRYCEDKTLKTSRQNNGKSQSESLLILLKDIVAN